MSAHADRAEAFRALHGRPGIFAIPKEKGTFEFARTAVSYADINRRFKR